MSTILFQERFADLVRCGSKTTTIRIPRKRPIEPGEALSLRRWTGLPYRSKQEVLREAFCVKLSAIAINGSFTLGGRTLFDKECYALARNDGFDSVADMVDWFRSVHGLPFSGHLIQWA